MWYTPNHYNDLIMSAMVFHITSLTIIYSTVYSGADQRRHQSSASLAFVRGSHRWPVNSPYKGPVTRKKVSIWCRHHDEPSIYLSQPRVNHISERGISNTLFSSNFDIAIRQEDWQVVEWNWWKLLKEECSANETISRGLRRHALNR